MGCFFPCALGDENDRAAINVADDSHLSMALAECLVIDVDAGDLDCVFPGESTAHSPLKDRSRLIPADANQGAGSLHGLTRLENVDDESHHEESEATMGLRPRHRHLHEAVLRTFRSRDAGMDEGLKLAGVQVSPGSLWGVVVAEQLILAVGARPQAAVGMLNVDVDLRRLDVKFHVARLPRSREAEDLLVGFHAKPGGYASGGRRYSPS